MRELKAPRIQNLSIRRLLQDMRRRHGLLRRLKRRNQQSTIVMLGLR